MALDRVDSTLGHFSSYLREWSARSYNKMHLMIPDIIESKQHHHVTTRDVFEIAPSVNAQLAYYDPPYGSNNEKMPPSRVRYSAYYHIWTTIWFNDEPTLFGKVNRREDTRDGVSPSIFEDFRRDKDDRFVAVEALRKLIEITPTKFIILSYSSGGRATASELHTALEESGSVLEIIEVDYKKKRDGRDEMDKRMA